MTREYDIAIAGGGLAGASLACCLARTRLRVAILEQHPLETQQQPSYDDRGLALSLASCRILSAAGVWAKLAARAVAIRHIHVSDRGSFGFVRLHAGDLHMDAFGYVVVAREIGRALLAQLSAIPNIDYLCPQTVTDIKDQGDSVRLELDGDLAGPLTCKLLVAADGSSSFIREKLTIETRVKDYQQTAIVSNITVDRDHGNTAYERFTRQGPLALLPMAGCRFVSVLSIPSDQHMRYMDMPDHEFLQAIQDISSMRPGRLIQAGKRQAYPLRLIQAKKQFSGRTVLLGNAAHTIHPNGAQGFNLGLRDAAALAEIIRKQAGQGTDPGASRILQDYVELRRQDQTRVIDFTDGLASLFYNDSIIKSVCRNFGLLMLDSLPLIKNKFALRAMGLDGKQPGLVRGLDLDQI